MKTEDIGMRPMIRIVDDHEVFKAWCLAHKKPIMHRLWIRTQVFGLCDECLKELHDSVMAKASVVEDFESGED